MERIGLIIVTAVTLGVAASAQPQDRSARKLADKMAVAFSWGLGELDRRHLIRGPLQVSLQLDVPDLGSGQKEFTLKRFRSFKAMEHWMTADPDHWNSGVDRQSGDRISCRRGLCRLYLAENQMAHNHVYLTHIWYGYSRGKIYVRKLRLLYG